MWKMERIKVYPLPTGEMARIAYKWLILQYMLYYMQKTNEEWVPRKSIKRELNFDERVLSMTLKRMEAEGWVVSGLNKRYKKYYRIGSRGWKFLEKYGDFLANNPYIQKI
jgi:DNA-binding PadR family transcriptional regulator